ncbi:hypothetical protein [Novacetimonas hansenii]|uniref:Uncharacterized protein n=1 Tax=Novacetimonas hansenii TaxID=436 RepID=A0AAW5EN59_NOVHA|nr:hypothetical protein [Novacetimonas hansenii]MCJ8352695.1 hypothetical protein [Novacetimonas hansenii]
MSGSITVPGYPTSNRVPGFYFALDNSRANTASYGRRVLIIAQATTGAALAGTARLRASPPVPVADRGS